MDKRRRYVVSSWRRMVRGALALAGLVSLATACGDCRETVDTGSTSQGLGAVTLKWSVASDPPFIALAPRSDGSALATTKASVVAIGPTGIATTLFAGPPVVGRPHVQEGTEGFLVPTGTGAEVYDAAGTRKASLTFSVNEYARLVPGTLDTFVPRAKSVDPENGAIAQGRIFSGTGALGAAFSAAGLVQSRTTRTHVLWATRSALTKTSLTGGTVWSSTTIAAHQFETDDLGRFLIVNRSGDTRVIELYDQTARIGASTFDAPVWNLAIAPAGQWAAANSKTVARLFKAGRLQASIPLDGLLPVSLDVSDLGYVLVGAQDRQRKTTAVSLFAANGALAWTKTLGDDTNGYRPDVRFAPDSRGFFIRERAGLSFYVMEAP